MNPTPAVALLMPQAVVGCQGRGKGVKASLVDPSCSEFDLPSISGEDSDQIKASLEKGKLLQVACNLAVAEPPTVCAPTAYVSHGCEGEAQ